MSSYGTTSGETRTIGAGIDEEDALLPRKHSELAISQRIHHHLTVDVDKGRGDLILLLCYVITGLLDSCATAAWGSFVSMQTGNTIYLGLGLADPEGSARWIKSGTSIACFCFGSFFFARFHRLFGPQRRWVLVANFTIQLLMILTAAMITTIASPVEVGDLDWRIVVPLALVAFQSSGQAVTSRVLSHGGLSSVVLTSIYCDLFSDARLFTWPTENTERNRRAAAPVLLLVGALVGGLWSRSDFGLSGALWVAVVLKGFIVLAWLAWKSSPARQDR